MYTVKELSEELNLSKTATYNWIKHKRVKNLTFKQNGKTFIKPEALEIIQGLKEEVDNIEGKMESVNNKRTSNPYKTKLDDDFKEVFSILKEQLEQKDIYIQEKNEQLRAKDEQINKLLKLNENAQVLMKEQQNKVLLLEEENQKSWWKKTFKT